MHVQLMPMQALDWNAIAEKCGTTPGAASKRYSRMKQAFESGAEPPASGGAASPGGAKTPAKATPKKAKAAAATEGEGTPTPKRKRAPAKKKGDEVKQEDDGDDAEQAKSPKKPRVTKKGAAKAGAGGDEQAEDTSATEETEQVKSEVKEEGEGSIDVAEWVGDLVEDGSQQVEV